MKTTEQIFSSVARSIRLTAGERERLHAHLTEYMAHRPRRAPAYARPTHTVLITTLWGRVRIGIAAFFVLFLGSGGISYAAESAIPGDTLYAVKISINEKVLDVLNVSPEAKVEWLAQKMERRLDEVMTLVVQNRLDERSRDVIAAEVGASARAVGEYADEESTDPALALGLAIRVESVLSAHSEVLEHLDEMHETIRNEAAKLAGTMRSQALAVADLRAGERASPEVSMTLAVAAPTESTGTPEVSTFATQLSVGDGEDTDSFDAASGSGTARSKTAEMQEGSGVLEQNPSDSRIQTAAERMERLAREAIINVQNQRQKFASSLSTLSVVRIDETINMLTEGIARGQEELRDGRYQEALSLLREIYVKALRLNVFMRAEGRFDLRSAGASELQASAVEGARAFLKRDREADEDPADRVQVEGKAKDSNSSLRTKNGNHENGDDSREED